MEAVLTNSAAALLLVNLSIVLFLTVTKAGQTLAIIAPCLQGHTYLCQYQFLKKLVVAHRFLAFHLRVPFVRRLKIDQVGALGPVVHGVPPLVLPHPLGVRLVVPPQLIADVVDAQAQEAAKPVAAGSVVPSLPRLLNPFGFLATHGQKWTGLVS